MSCYSYREETKTMEFRWVVDSINEKFLQQKIVIREGYGIEAKFTEEWRDIPTIPFYAQDTHRAN